MLLPKNKFPRQSKPGNANLRIGGLQTPIGRLAFPGDPNPAVKWRRESIPQPSFRVRDMNLIFSVFPGFCAGAPSLRLWQGWGFSFRTKLLSSVSRIDADKHRGLGPKKIQNPAPSKSRKD